MSTRKPWRRQPGESAKAYTAFCTYRDLSTSERSIDTAWRATSQGQTSNAKRAPGQWAIWSSKHEWVSRAAAYDEHLAEQDRLLWEKRRRQLQERDWQQADALRAVVEDAIPHAQGFIRRRQHTTADGETIITLAFDITALAKVLTDASKLQRLATDEPTEHTKLSGAALDAYIAAQLARLAHGGEAGSSDASEPDSAETNAGTDADDSDL